MLQFMKIIASCILLASSAALMAEEELPKEFQINQKSTFGEVHIEFPQGFSKKIDTEIFNHIQKKITIFNKEAFKYYPDNYESAVPNYLGISYKTAFNNSKLLSIEIATDIYFGGSPHSNLFVTTLNFLNEQPLTLARLFGTTEKGLDFLSTYCRNDLYAQMSKDVTSIESGTEPTEDNFRSYIFTPNGIEVIFDAYRVAGFADGQQRVKIPKSVLKNKIKIDVYKQVWVP